MEEKKFPIYLIDLHWNQEGYENNFTSWYDMFAEPLTEEQTFNLLKSRKEYMVTHYKEKGTPILEFLSEKCDFVENESWTLTWFSHYTLNNFDTDEEALRSFQEYVDRKSRTNECLMGAEDEWRWKLCRCEHCTKKGRITIDH